MASSLTGFRNCSLTCLITGKMSSSFRVISSAFRSRIPSIPAAWKISSHTPLNLRNTQIFKPQWRAWNYLRHCQVLSARAQKNATVLEQLGAKHLRSQQGGFQISCCVVGSPEERRCSGEGGGVSLNHNNDANMTRSGLSSLRDLKQETKVFISLRHSKWQGISELDYN